MKYTVIDLASPSPERLIGSLMNLITHEEAQALDPGNFFQVVSIGFCDDAGEWQARVRHYQDSRFDQVNGGIDWNAD